MSAFDGLKIVSDHKHLWQKKRKQRTKPPRRDPSALPCLNCDRLLPRDRGHPYMFCSDRCSEFARHIRYVRGCRLDGRINQERVQKAIAVERGHILAGGYSKRPIPKKRRDEVFARDQGQCVRCGQPGTQIHHMRGPSNALDNLQLLCQDCHLEESSARLVPISDADLAPAAREAAYDRAAELDERIEVKKPLRQCDDYVNWDKKIRHRTARERSSAALAVVHEKKE